MTDNIDTDTTAADADAGSPPSPRPWRVAYGPSRGHVILGADGGAVAATCDTARQIARANAVLIAAAVNYYGDRPLLLKRIAQLEAELKDAREAAGGFRRAVQGVPDATVSPHAAGDRKRSKQPCES